MKRLLISFSLSLFLVIAWAVLSSILLVTVLRGNTWFLDNQSFPLMVPIGIYEFFSPIPDGSVFLVMFLMIVGSAIIYTIPIYMLISMAARFRKSKPDRVTSSSSPPSPPSFDV